MTGFDVTSQGPDGGELERLLAQGAYQAGRDRNASAHLPEVLATQAVLDRLCAQAEHAANLPAARRTLLLELQAANAGYAAVLRRCVKASSPELADACELSRRTVVSLAATLG